MAAWRPGGSPDGGRSRLRWRLGTLPLERPMRDGLRILDADAHVIEPQGAFGDVPAGMDAMDLPATTPFVPCGDLDKIGDQLEHGFDPPSYLRAMDAEGIDAAVLYPSM